MNKDIEIDLTEYPLNVLKMAIEILKKQQDDN